jgi:allantoin racemase
MKIGIMHVVPAEENTPDATFIKTWDILLRKNIDLVKAEGTEITFQVPRRGLGPNAIVYNYMLAFNDIETLHGYMELQKAGIYDAIIGLCFFDPMIREAKQALDVPFIGCAEVAMHMAAMMGAKFGVISADVGGKWNIEEEIRRYGLQDRALPVRGTALSLQEQIAGLTDAHVCIESAIEVSRELIADGAEVIIPGCMFLDPVLAMAPGCENDYPNGLREVDGVPILNVVALTIKVAEAFACMKKAGFPWISRKLYYNSAKGNEKALEESRALMEYKGPGFWLD